MHICSWAIFCCQAILIHLCCKRVGGRLPGMHILPCSLFFWWVKPRIFLCSAGPLPPLPTAFPLRSTPTPSLSPTLTVTPLPPPSPPPSTTQSHAPTHTLWWALVVQLGKEPNQERTLVLQMDSSLQVAILEDWKEMLSLTCNTCMCPCTKTPPPKLGGACNQGYMCSWCVDCPPSLIMFFLSFPVWLLLQPCWTSAGSWCRGCQPHWLR